MPSEVNQEFVLAALDLLLRGGFNSGESAEQPKISVIMPVLNRASMIEDALASLDRQSCRDFEAIVVNDGSTDGTAETLQRWTQRAPWIRVLTNPQRLGHPRSC